MRLLLLHLDPPSDNDPREEAYVFIPGLEGVVLPVPIDALPSWLPGMDTVLDDRGPQRCPSCGEPPVSAEAAELFGKVP